MSFWSACKIDLHPQEGGFPTELTNLNQSAYFSWLHEPLIPDALPDLASPSRPSSPSSPTAPSAGPREEFWDEPAPTKDVKEIAACKPAILSELATSSPDAEPHVEDNEEDGCAALSFSAKSADILTDGEPEVQAPAPVAAPYDPFNPDEEMSDNPATAPRFKRHSKRGQHRGHRRKQRHNRRLFVRSRPRHQSRKKQRQASRSAARSPRAEPSEPLPAPAHKGNGEKRRLGKFTSLLSGVLSMWVLLCFLSLAYPRLQLPPDLPNPMGITSLMVSASSIISAIPDGHSHNVPDALYTKDSGGGWTWGNAPCLNDTNMSDLQDTVRKRKSVFAYSMKDLTGYTGEPVTLPMKDPTARIWTPARRESPLEREVKDEKCTELAEAGIIRPSNSCQYASATTCPAKKDADGNWVDKRFCVDLRKFNEGLIPDKYGLHHVDDMFQQLLDSVVFTKIDLRSGFHQIPIAPEEQEKASFWWKNQLWCYTRMPYGIQSSSAHFQKRLDYEIAKAGLNHCAQAFIDDIIIHSARAEDHASHVAAVLDMLKNCGLYAHPDKSIFGADCVEYLGHNVSSYGVSPLAAKVQAIQDLPQPANVTELRSILGFTGYYRQYVPNYSSIAQPLNKLLQKNIQYEWTAECAEALQQIKDCISKPNNALRRYNPELPTQLYTDWSNKGLGALLTQTHADGNEYLVACISRSLNKHERNYSSPKGETLAVVWACKMLRPYLHGIRFRIITDHQALKWILTTDQLSGQFARWALSLMDYDFSIEHRPGKDNIPADTFSRFPSQSVQDGTGARLDEECDPVRTFASFAHTLTASKYQVPRTLISLHVTQSLTESSNIDAYAPKADMWLPDYLAIPAYTELNFTTQRDTARTKVQQAVKTALPELKSHSVSQHRSTCEPRSQPTGPLDVSPIPTSFFKQAVKGVVVVELFGGLASGVEMLLRCDVPISRVYYCDKYVKAQQCAAAPCAAHRMHLLAGCYLP